MKHCPIAAILAACLVIAVCPAGAVSPAADVNTSVVQPFQVVDRASVQTIQIHSPGAQMNACVYVAAGKMTASR